MRFDRLVREALDGEDEKACTINVRARRASEANGGDRALQFAMPLPPKDVSDPGANGAVDGSPNGRPDLPWWLVVLAHTQGLVTASTTLGVICFRSAHALYYVGASLATSFAAKGLKRVIKQPRPANARAKSQHGMPSTHSATVTFMATYLAVVVLSPPSSAVWTSALGTGVTAVTVTLLVTFPPAVMYSRVKLGMHTAAQCSVGALLGCLFCACFSALWRVGFADAAAVKQIDALISRADRLLLHSFRAVRPWQW